MADWAPVLVGVVLFVLLSPGLLFSLPGHHRTLDFGGMKTVTLTQCDLRRDVRLNEMAKTYFISLYGDGSVEIQDANSVQNPKSKVQSEKAALLQRRSR